MATINQMYRARCQAQRIRDAEEADGHGYTGEVPVGEYCFKYVNGVVVTVSYYDDADNFREVPFKDWKGDDTMAADADEIAHTEYLAEVRNAH